MEQDPFLQKSMIGGDPPDDYPSCELLIEDVAYDNDIIEEDPSSVLTKSVDVQNET